MQDLVTLGGSLSYAYGVSADGSVVMGRAQNGSGQYRDFRWTQSGGMQDLGTLGGSQSEAHGVSADGSAVVGTAQNGSGQYRAFLWRGGVLQDLGQLYNPTSPPDLFEARAISSNGRYIVESGDNPATNLTEAFLLDLGKPGKRLYAGRANLPAWCLV